MDQEGVSLTSNDERERFFVAKDNIGEIVKGRGRIDDGTHFSNTSYTMNIEIYRGYGLIGMIVLLLIGKFLTDKYVDIEPEDTVVYQLFGFNHACNYLDHHPARVVSALLVQAFTIPMTIFIVGSYFRTRHAYQCGKVPKWLSTYNNITTVYNFLANTYFYMVFVNPPYDEHTGFIGHYLPYLAWKISQAFMAIEQVYFMIYTDTRFPCGVPATAAKIYAISIAVLTVIYSAVVLSITFENPFLLDPINNDLDRFLARGMMTIYTILVVFVQAALAFLESRNGNLSTVMFSNVYEG